MLEEVREKADQARHELEGGKPAEAAAALEEALRLDPGEVGLRQRLARVYVQLGYRAHPLAELQHVAGRYAAEGELFKAIAVGKLVGAIDPGRQQTLRAIGELYALHLEGSETAPLPANMAGALVAQEPAADLDLEALAIFRTDPLPP